MNIIAFVFALFLTLTYTPASRSPPRCPRGSWARSPSPRCRSPRPPSFCPASPGSGARGKSETARRNWSEQDWPWSTNVQSLISSNGVKLEMSLGGKRENVTETAERGKACSDHWGWTMRVIMVKFAGMTGTPGDNIWEISWSNNAWNNVKNNNSDLSLKSDYNWRMLEFKLDATDFFQLISLK